MTFYQAYTLSTWLIQNKNSYFLWKGRYNRSLLSRDLDKKHIELKFDARGIPGEVSEVILFVKVGNLQKKRIV